MFYAIAASPKLPLTPFIPFSPARCREFWEALPSSLKNRAVEDAKALCPVVWPQILACDFLEYTRSGNRIRFEDKQFARRTALGTLVLAEACDYKGTFLDDIINGIYLICEETAWQLPPIIPTSVIRLPFLCLIPHVLSSIFLLLKQGPCWL